MIRLSRRELLRCGLVVGGLSLLAGCGQVSLPGQRKATLRRIGVLDAGNNPNDAVVEPFYEWLRDLGYVEGQNILIERRNAGGNLERLSALAAELVDLQVEVLVARDSTAAAPASRATSTIPIVVAGGNVLSAGLVANIAHPEGNITGVSTNAGETYGKWVELLKETVPLLSHLAIVTSSISGSNDQAIERIADAFRLQSRWSRLSSLDELPSTLATAKADGADGLVVLSTAVISNGSDPRIGSAVLKSRLPAVAEGRDFAVNGGLLAHGTVPGSNPRRADSYVDKVLRGAKPGDLPIELPTEFAIVVNLNTVRDLGITVPQSVLQRATEIIQ